MTESEQNIIDWQLASLVAGNNRQIAEELLQCLTQSLQNDLTLMKNTFNQQAYSELKALVHKLHGALCYCGLPRLKLATASLEKALINKDEINIPFLFTQFELEVYEVMQAASLYFSS